MYSVGLSVSFLAFHLHPPTVGQIEKNCLRKEINSSLFSNKTVGRNGLFKIRSKNKLIHQKIYYIVPFGGLRFTDKNMKSATKKKNTVPFGGIQSASIFVLQFFAHFLEKVV